MNDKCATDALLLNVLWFKENVICFVARPTAIITRVINVIMNEKNN